MSWMLKKAQTVSFGHQLARNDIHKCRLSFAVGSNQSNMLALKQAERNVFEDSSVTKPMRQMFNSQNTHNTH